MEEEVENSSKAGLKAAAFCSDGGSVRLVGDLFVSRRDCYCVQLEHGYVKVDEPLTDDVLQEHIRGKLTVGSYQLTKDDLVKWLCFDLDPEKLSSPRETAIKILNVCLEQKEEADGRKRPRVWPRAVLLEASRYPDSSFHIWILFEPEVHAKVAQWLGYRLLELAGLNPKQIEVFPKQTELSTDRPFGNFVKLPLGKHQVANKWSTILDCETFEPLPNEVLLEARGISFAESDLTKIMAFKGKDHVQIRFDVATSFKALKNKEEEKIALFLAKYWTVGRRNRLELAFLGWAIKRGVAYESARRIIQRVTELTHDEEAAARLQMVDYHYKNRIRMASELLGIAGLREIMRETMTI